MEAFCLNLGLLLRRTHMTSDVTSIERNSILGHVGRRSVTELVKVGHSV